MMSPDFEPTWKQHIPTFNLKLINDNSLWFIRYEIDNKEVRKYEIKNLTVSNLKTFDKIGEIKIPEPVYIKSIEGKEQIVCNTSIMKSNIIYDIIWNGEKYGVRKSSKGIELLEFVPDRIEENE